MNKQIIIIIVITAILTFLGTRIFEPHSNEKHGHSEHHDEHGDEHGSELSYSPEILKEFGILENARGHMVDEPGSGYAQV